MENMVCLNNDELLQIDGGVETWEMVLDLCSYVYPPLGIFLTIKTVSDWLDEQPW